MAPAKSGGAAALRKVKKAQPLPSRIANAKELRRTYAILATSPDGVDPEPLTVPKCVECSHCGWPIYPRESRVATRKTFEKAGINRDAENEAEKKKKARALAAMGGGPGAGAGAGAGAGGQGEDGDPLDIGEEDDEVVGDDDESSVGTVELLENEVEELKQKNAELQSEKEGLEEENAELKTQVDDLEEALSAAEEKIILLEESEVRWREKNSILRQKNEDLTLRLDRMSNRVGDLETDMVNKLLEIKWRKEAAARCERRRTLMLARMEVKVGVMQGSGLLSAIFVLWRDDVQWNLQKQRTQDFELQRRLEVGELKDQLSQEKEHVLSLEAVAARLRGNLKAAGQRLLTKVFSTTQKPWADGHALHAWCSAHPTIKYENELIRTNEDLLDVRGKLISEETTTAGLTVDLQQCHNKIDEVSGERDQLARDLASISSELARVAGNQSKNAMDIQKRAEEKSKAAQEKLTQDIWGQARLQMDGMKAEFEMEKNEFEDKLGALQAQLEALQRAMGTGPGGQKGDDRVVPKGQGVMCCGCLRQIVNRGVKQLPPVDKMKAGVVGKENDEKEKASFFQKELNGMPDPDDCLHSEVWKLRRDPMKGLSYSAFAGDPAWPTSSRSMSLPKLSPQKPLLKKKLAFKPAAGFR